MEYQRIRVDRHPGYEESVIRITLARPEVFNAFDALLIEELTRALEEAGGTAGARAILLRGEGKHFCAGADINWMRSSMDYTQEENLEDARRMQTMFRSFAENPLPVVGRIHGVALGGGSGLTASCDVALALEGASFAFTEVRLGIIPAVVSTFVVRKIGLGRARSFFLTAERFGTARAYEIGLIHKVCPDGKSLDSAVNQTLDDLIACGPEALAAAKRLLLDLEGKGPEERYDHAVKTIAEIRVGEEAQAGLRAFLEKKGPPWEPRK